MYVVSGPETASGGYVSPVLRTALEFSLYMYLLSGEKHIWMSVGNSHCKADYDTWTPWPKYTLITSNMFVNQTIHDLIKILHDKQLIRILLMVKFGGLSFREYALKVCGG